MDEQLLKQNVEKMLFLSFPSLYVLNALKDEVLNYQISSDGNLTLTEKKGYTEFLENIKLTIDSNYLSDYMKMISVPKLEEKKREGQTVVNYKYKTLNNNWYNVSSMLADFNGDKVVLLTSKKASVNLNAPASENYSKLVESVADSIYKVHNVFSIDNKSEVNIKNIEQYIDAVFSQLIKSYPHLKNTLNKKAVNISGMSDGTLLIVDDDLVTRNMIKKIFDGEYKIVTANNGKEAIDYLEQNGNKGLMENSDNILGIFLDLTMPVLDGFAVLEYLSNKNYLSKVPVIIISGDYEKETKTRVYGYNIADMLEKPFDFQVVKHRISNFINLYKSSNSLSSIINDQGILLKDIINKFVESYKIDYEKNIISLKKYMTIFINQIMHDYPEFNIFEENAHKMVDAIEYYDIGFYSIPRSVLNKKGNFSNDEILMIKNYPLFSAKLLSYVLNLVGDEEYKRYAIDIAKYYHENYDGSGYPNGLSKDNIPIVAQIASIVIMYNNLLRKTDPKTAIDKIIKKSNMFNPKLVDSFSKIIDEIKNV